MKRSPLLISLVLCPALWLTACAKPAGGPLSHTFDNTRLASVGLESKQAVAEAQQQHDLAVQQHAKAEDDFRGAEIEEEVAQYQAEHAVLVVQLVGNKLNDKPQLSGETSALARRAADAKVEFMRARRVYLAALSNSTYYAVYAAQAKLELERAKVAQSSGVAGAGFDLSGFQTQAEQRERAAASATAETDKQHEAAGNKLAAWSEAERAFIQTSGMKGPSESARAVLEWKQPTPAAKPSVEASAPAAK